MDPRADRVDDGSDGGRDGPGVDGPGADRVAPRRIGQIAVVVEDVERAVAFYRDVLGLELLFRAPPSLAFFRCGEVRLMLSPPEGDGPRGPGSILYYDVGDSAAAHRALEAGPGETVAEPHVVHRTPEMELWIGFYRDPEGNTFATMEERSL